MPGISSTYTAVYMTVVADDSEVQAMLESIGNKIEGVDDILTSLFAEAIPVAVQIAKIYVPKRGGALEASIEAKQIDAYTYEFSADAINPTGNYPDPGYYSAYVELGSHPWGGPTWVEGTYFLAQGISAGLIYFDEQAMAALTRLFTG